jgi:hypothetical protein
MREILTRLVARGRGSIHVEIFGDKAIQDEGRHCDRWGQHYNTDRFLVPQTLKTGRVVIS